MTRRSVISARVFACLALLAQAVNSSAGAPAEYSHRVWRIEDGLPQNRIRAIAQTADGYLWVGTSEGLARFDGARFTVFDRANTPALRDDGILALLVAHDGTLWIGTEGGGLVRYGAKTFRNYGPGEGLTNGFVRSLFEDRAHSLWVGTDRGFFRVKGETLERLDNTPAVGLASINSMAEDSGGRLWALSSTSLLTVANGQLMPAPTVCAGPVVRSLRGTASGEIWAFPALGAARLLDGCMVADSRIPPVPIRSAVTDTSGALWLGTSGRGLYRVERNAAAPFLIPAGLPDKTVNAIFEDREHDLWIGCEDGLLRLSRSSVTNVGSGSGLDDENVLTTYAAPSGDVWLATLTGQVYVVSKGRVSRHVLPGAARDLQIRTVFEDSRGAFWFGTFGSGVVREERGAARVFTKRDGLRGVTVRQILEDRAGNIWLALNSGVSRWNGTSFRNYYLEDGITYPSTRALLLDSAGDVLVATDAGLNRIHEGEVSRSGEFAALAREKIWAVYQSARGTLWLGTRGGGLIRFRSGAATRFTRANGLPSDTIFQIVAGTGGKLWLSTSSGVASGELAELEDAGGAHPQLTHITPFGTSDGLASSQMNGGIQPAGARTRSGELWFPGVKGAVRVDPTAMPQRRLPPVIIERLTAGDQGFALSPEVRIPPGRGRIQIDFTLCDLTGAQRVTFRYKLEGFDESWSPALRARSANYTNLPPRRYRFRVQALDPAASSSVSETQLAFEIEPAFYQTWWFSALIALTCTALVWAGFALYARQTRARYQLLLAERTRLAREMHDTVIQGCVGVSTLLEASAGYRKRDAAEAERLFQQARAQAIDTLEEAREAVWDLRHAPASDSPVAMLLELARKLGSEHAVQIETSVTGKISADPETERTILLVGREALRNAIAHANATKIRVQLAFTSSRVELIVSDDGGGFASAGEGSAAGKHFGLIGMKERIEKSGGLYVLDTKPGQGTTVKAVLPVVRAA